MSAPASLSTRDRRALLGGVLVLAVLVLGSRGLPALRRTEATARADLARTAVRVARLEARSPQEPSARSALRRGALEWQSRCLRSPTVARAIEELVQHVGSLADFAEAVVLVATPDGIDTEARGLTRIGLRISLEGDTEAVLSFLRELELGSPMVVVRQLRLVQSSAAADADTAERIRAEIRIDALTMIAETGSDA